VEAEMVGSIEMGNNQSGRPPQSRLEVAILERDGKPYIALHLSTFSDALGWQVQKTIPFSSDKIAQLQRLLIESRLRLEDQSVTGQIIPFAQRPIQNTETRTASDSNSDSISPLERAG